jgi:spore photoproduct lyase
MKSYLNFSPLTVYADPAPSLKRIQALAQKNPHRILRVGTGETGDSLLLDPLFDLSRPLIEGLADFPNVYLELKTKTTHVDHLLDIPKKGNAIMAFSLNAKEIQEQEEGTSASIEERVSAAVKASEAGYNLAFHFDPIVRFPNWKESYSDTIELLKKVPAHRIRWISLGTLRFTSALRDRLEDRPYLFEEFVPCRDGKYRYLQPIRIQMYKWFLKELSMWADTPIYLCMESVDVWKAVYGDTPMKLDALRDIFIGIPCKT